MAKNKKMNKSKDMMPPESEPQFRVNDRRLFRDIDEVTPVEEHELAKPSFVEELEKKIKLQEEKVSQLSMALHAQREEHKKSLARIERDLDNQITQTKANAFAEFLEVADNLDRCIQSLEEAGVGEGAQAGVKMIQTQLLEVLRGQGLEPIDCLNKPFNPNLCEALGVQETEDKDQDNVVLSELQTGYQMGEHLVRAAKVQVGRFVERKA